MRTGGPILRRTRPQWMQAMSEPVFFPLSGPVSLSEIAALAGATLPPGTDGEAVVRAASPLESAGPDDLAYMDNAKYGDALAATRARACLVSPRFSARCRPARSPW